MHHTNLSAGEYPLELAPYLCSTGCQGVKGPFPHPFFISLFKELGLKVMQIVFLTQRFDQKNQEGLKF